MYPYLDPTLPAVDTFALTLKTTHSNLCLIQHNWGPAELTQGSWIDPGPGSIQQNWLARTLPPVMAWLWMAHRWDYSLSCCKALEQKCLKRLGLCFSLNCRKLWKNRGSGSGLFTLPPRLHHSATWSQHWKLHINTKNMTWFSRIKISSEPLCSQTRDSSCQKT